MQNIVTLGQINDALKITSVTAAQLAEMGFAALENKPICEALPPEESRRLRNAKLYQADSIVQIRVALAKRLAAPASCLHQIQEPPTKTEALAHYSQQAILAMSEAGGQDALPLAAYLCIEESGAIDFEVLPPCTLPPGEYDLYAKSRTTQAAQQGGDKQ